MAKKKTKGSKLTTGLFKLPGPQAKLKIVDKKKALYYFAPKIKPEKAQKMALADGAELLDVSANDAKAGKPVLKYDFYCIYDVQMKLKFLRPRIQEIGVNDEVEGVLVGKEVFLPRKGKEIPGKAIKIPMVELFSISRSESMILDGTTGAQARSLEKLLKGAGKKKATPSWIKKAKVTPGKYNSLEKVVKAVAKVAGAKPKEAKRVVEHTLTFQQLNGFYVPMYYVKVTADNESRIMRINAVNGSVAVKI